MAQCSSSWRIFKWSAPIHSFIRSQNCSSGGRIPPPPPPGGGAPPPPGGKPPPPPLRGYMSWQPRRLGSSSAITGCGRSGLMPICAVSTPYLVSMCWLHVSTEEPSREGGALALRLTGSALLLPREGLPPTDRPRGDSRPSCLSPCISGMRSSSSSSLSSCGSDGIRLRLAASTMLATWMQSKLSPTHLVSVGCVSSALTTFSSSPVGSAGMRCFHTKRTSRSQPSNAISASIMPTCITRKRPTLVCTPMKATAATRPT
mmetsp:Transcript_20401/g.51368  ORF Transcript_20401/g.51368 Transcript_20401/m.51368 type:complete len:259 (+) Transcript_20401:678-1454(+)